MTYNKPGGVSLLACLALIPALNHFLIANFRFRLKDYRTMHAATHAVFAGCSPGSVRIPPRAAGLLAALKKSTLDRERINQLRNSHWMKLVRKHISLGMF